MARRGSVWHVWHGTCKSLQAHSMGAMHECPAFWLAEGMLAVGGGPPAEVLLVLPTCRPSACLAGWVIIAQLAGHPQTGTMVYGQ